MFTKQELQLLAKIINSTPLQGTIQTLPALLTEVVRLQKKVIELLEGPTPETNEEAE